jgi:hypothetical protein
MTYCEAKLNPDQSLLTVLGYDANLQIFALKNPSEYQHTKIKINLI